MRTLALILILSAWLQAPASPPVPVVVELFTSEGCSDCPPADRVLSELGAQAGPNVRVLILGEHVDYFNHDGWTDPFSSGIFTDRQLAYDRGPNPHTPFTPEMIVDGAAHFVGSDRSAALAAVRRAVRQPKKTIALQWSSTAPGMLEATVDAGPSASGAQLVLAVTQDGLTSNVRAGENGGRTLTHDGVVRWLSVVGKADGKGQLHRSAAVKFDPAWREARHVIALLQRDGGPVLAVGEIDRP